MRSRGLVVAIAVVLAVLAAVGVIVYTSNVMAILGLRAMYFLLAAMMTQFRFLRHGLSLVLVFIGARMLFDRWIDLPTAVTLLAVCGILAAAVVASLMFPPKADREKGS